MSASGKLGIITFILQTQLGMGEAQGIWVYAASQVNRNWFAQPFWNLSHKQFISDRRQINYKIWISKLYEEKNPSLLATWKFDSFMTLISCYFESIWVNGLILAQGFNKKSLLLSKKPIVPHQTHHPFGIKNPHLALAANLLTSII